MKRRILELPLLILLLLALAACAPAERVEPEVPQSAVTAVAPTVAATEAVAPANTAMAIPPTASRPAETPPAPSTGATAQEAAFDAARSTLVKAWGVEEAALELLSIEAVEWESAALGCPLPNARYAQALTPGFLVLLTAEGKVYEVHTDTTGRAVLCQDGMPQFPPIPVTPGEIQDGDPWMPVDPPASEESNSP